jgi:hypothetical protein
LLALPGKSEGSQLTFVRISWVIGVGSPPQAERRRARARKEKENRFSFLVMEILSFWSRYDIQSGLIIGKTGEKSKLSSILHEKDLVGIDIIRGLSQWVCAFLEAIILWASNR